MGNTKLKDNFIENYSDLEKTINEIETKYKGRGNAAITENVLLDSLKNTFEECYKIAEAKNNDYAKTDNPFANFEQCVHLGISVEQGILVRISDKISRVSNLINPTHNQQVKNESIYDTLNDIINYVAILKGYIEQKK